MAVALGFGSLLLFFIVNGYSFDRQTGNVIQNGLVFVNSNPVSSTIYINGTERGGTDGRFVLNEGSYSLELRRDGYRSWKNDFTLEGGSIERFVYPFLFPSRLQSADSQLYAAAPDMASISPDRRWLVTHRLAAFNSFEVTDTTTETNETVTITVPASILVPKAGAQRLELVEWSTDNRRFLVKHTYEGGQDFVMIDRTTPAESYNVTQVFGKAYSQVSLYDKRFDRLYLYSAEGGVLQRGDVGSRTVETVASKIVAYWPYGGDMVLYVTDQGAETGKVIFRLIEGGTVHTIRSLPASEKYLMDAARFNNRLYVAVGTTAESKVYLFEDPQAARNLTRNKLPLAKALLRVDAASKISFSANARFIALQGNGQFAVYDAENNRQFRYDTGLKPPTGQDATWMDGHRLALVSDNKLYVFDFDGKNRQTLNAVLPGFPPFFNQNYTALFTISPSGTVPDKPALVRTELIVKN